MFHTSSERSPYRSDIVYVPSLKGSSRQARRNLHRDLRHKNRMETATTLAVFPGIPTVCFGIVMIGPANFAGLIHIWLMAILGFILLASAGVGFAKWDTRTAADSLPIYPVNDIRMNELQRTLKDRKLYSGESAWDRFHCIMHGNSKVTCTDELDKYVTAYMENMKEYPDLLRRLEANTKGNEEITQRWVQHSEELEAAAAKCADAITQIIDAHEFPLAHAQKGIPIAAEASLEDLLQLDDLKWIHEQTNLANDTFFKQGHTERA